MLAVLLGILKVMGMILLVLILILLLAICYLLFLPLGVKIYLSYDTVFDARISLCGFTGFFRALAEYHAGEFTWNLQAFWGKCRIAPKEAAEAADISQDENVSDAETSDELSPDEAASSPDFKTSTDAKRSAVVRKKHAGATEKKLDKPDEKQRQALSVLLGEVMAYLKKIRPRVTEADADYSLGDSADTGMFTGAISLWPGVYGKKVKLRPDFMSDELYLKGYIQLEKRIYMIHLLVFLLRIILNKDIRSLFESAS